MIRIFLVLLIIFSMVWLGDCGSESFIGTCCLNGEFYSCPDEEAVNLCGEFDPSECTRDATRDDECPDS